MWFGKNAYVHDEGEKFYWKNIEENNKGYKNHSHTTVIGENLIFSIFLTCLQRRPKGLI